MSKLVRKTVKLTADHYRLIGMIINDIPDEGARALTADHFGTAFNGRSSSFDPYQWEKLTGGKVAPNSAKVRGWK